MSMTDPISDMLTRIRNAMAVDKRFVILPFEKKKNAPKKKRDEARRTTTQKLRKGCLLYTSDAADE